MEELVDIPAINVNATLRVTHTILPGMVERYVNVFSQVVSPPKQNPLGNVASS